MRVLVAPDSFKGTVSAGAAAAALAAGWRVARPGDDVIELPLADGGEGSLDVIATARENAQWQTVVVLGPDDRRVPAPWLLLPDGTAVIESARAAGLPLMLQPDAVHAHTAGVGELLNAVLAHPDVERIVVAVGGSASTDAGSGALAMLGAEFLDAAGRPLRRGGGALIGLAAVDSSDLHRPPSGGVDLLVDVGAPLVGAGGAAREFAAQKGATPAQIELLEKALRRFAEVVGGNPAAPGSGAAGGLAFGLRELWSARLVPGAAALCDLVGLAEHLESADLVVTGEGQLDEQSLQGKVVGHVLQAAAVGRTPVWACVGRVRGAPPPGIDRCWALDELAGSIDSAMARPAHHLYAAGRTMAGCIRSWPRAAQSTTAAHAASD